MTGEWDGLSEAEVVPVYCIWFIIRKIFEMDVQMYTETGTTNPGGCGRGWILFIFS